MVLRDPWASRTHGPQGPMGLKDLGLKDPGPHGGPRGMGLKDSWASRTHWPQGPRAPWRAPMGGLGPPGAHGPPHGAHVIKAKSM